MDLSKIFLPSWTSRTLRHRLEGDNTVPFERVNWEVDFHFAWGEKGCYHAVQAKISRSSRRDLSFELKLDNRKAWRRVEQHNL